MYTKFRNTTLILLVLAATHVFGAEPVTGTRDTAIASAADPVLRPAKKASAADYRLGAGDVLHVSVWKNTDLSRTVTITPDGKISLPLIGEIQVDGMTPADVQKLLVDKMVEYVDDPARNVFVIVEQVNSYQVSVMGEVNRPGRYKIQGNTMVIDVLSEAGGLTEFASESSIIIFRREGENIKRIPFNYKELVAGKGNQEMFFVQPGDVVLVP